MKNRNLERDIDRAKDVYDSMISEIESLEADYDRMKDEVERLNLEIEELKEKLRDYENN